MRPRGTTRFDDASERRDIVVISSILARIAVPGYTGYSASKAGLLGLVRSLAAELAPDNVQVNAICPGWVDTDMAWQGLDLLAEAIGGTREQAYEQAMSEVPLRRMSQPGGHRRHRCVATFRGLPRRHRADDRPQRRRLRDPEAGRAKTYATAHRTAPSTNGIQSPVALAIAPAAAGPTNAPTAQAALMKPNAMPCGRATFSAPSAIKANAGVKSMPNAAAQSDDQRRVDHRPRPAARPRTSAAPRASDDADR